MTTPFQKKILRPYGKWSDILPVAWALAFVLSLAGSQAGLLLLRIPQADMLMDSLAAGPEAAASLKLYLGSVGTWILTLGVILFYPPDRPMLKAIRHNRRGNTLRMGLLGLLIGSGLYGMCLLISVIAGGITLSSQGIRPFLATVFLAAVFLQSGAEELVLRCFLYQKLRRRYRHPAVAIAGSALLFCLMHLADGSVSLPAILQLIAAGLLLSLIIYYYGSFWGVCGLHTGWNYGQEVLFGVESGFAGVILIAILCVLVVISGRRKNQREDLWQEAARAYETV